MTAFNFAEKFRFPVILAPDEVIGHLRENMVIPEPGDLAVIDRKKPSGPPEDYKPFAADADGVAPLSAYGSEYIFHVSSSMHGPDGYSNNNPGQCGLAGRATAPEDRDAPG